MMKRDATAVWPVATGGRPLNVKRARRNSAVAVEAQLLRLGVPLSIEVPSAMFENFDDGDGPAKPSPPRTDRHTPVAAPAAKAVRTSIPKTIRRIAASLSA